MAELVLYMAPSGSGKSSSLRNLPPEQTVIITPNSKSLPFPGGDKDYVAGKNRIIAHKLNGDPLLPDSDFGRYPIKVLLKSIAEQRPEVNYIIIDDFTHYFSERIFSPEFLSQNTGNQAFQRWNEFGADVFQALFAETPKLRDDLYIGILHHTELKDDGTRGFKSSGKLLDNTIDVPSYFTYIFHGFIQETDGVRRYLMQTNESAGRQAKTPYGLYGPDELYVNNDLFEVFKKIHAYRHGDVKVEWT